MKNTDLIYQPDYLNSDRWEYAMFQLRDPPPKLPSWQDYFTGEDPDSFLFFLHYYEPELTRIANSFVYRFGLYDQLADVKMVCVEKLLRLRKKYKLSDGKDFLNNIRLKLAEPVKRYAMKNLKGFTEKSATHYYELRKTAVIYNSNCHDHTYNEIIATLCEQIGMREKKAGRLLREMWELDNFQWYDDDLLDEDGNEVDTGIAGSDILGYTRKMPPESTTIRRECQRLVTESFEELTEMEQEVIGLHLGFCGNCFYRFEPKTYDEIADIYQFGTENGVLKFYHRALDKLRTILDKKGLFYSVRLKRVNQSAREVIYEYTPLDLGEHGTIAFNVRRGVIQSDYEITETAELDFQQSQRIGHAAARLLLRMSREKNLPADRVLPLPPGSVGVNK